MHAAEPATEPCSTSPQPPRGAGPASSVKRALAIVSSTFALPTSASILTGIERQSPFKKAARLHHVLWGSPLVRESDALEIQVHRVGICRVFGSPRFGCNELEHLARWRAAIRFRPAYRTDRRQACRSVRPRGDCRFRHRQAARSPEAGCRYAAQSLRARSGRSTRARSV